MVRRRPAVSPAARRRAAAKTRKKVKPAIGRRVTVRQAGTPAAHDDDRIPVRPPRGGPGAPGTNVSPTRGLPARGAATAQEQPASPPSGLRQRIPPTRTGFGGARPPASSGTEGPWTGQSPGYFVRARASPSVGGSRPFGPPAFRAARTRPSAPRADAPPGHGGGLRPSNLFPPTAD